MAPGVAQAAAGTLGSAESEAKTAWMSTPVRYSYRRLTRADVSLLKDLLGVFGEAFGEINTYQHSVPGDDYLTRLLTKQHLIAVVAMNGKEVGGGLAAYELDRRPRC